MKSTSKKLKTEKSLESDSGSVPQSTHQAKNEVLTEEVLVENAVQQRGMAEMSQTVDDQGWHQNSTEFVGQNSGYISHPDQEGHEGDGEYYDEEFPAQENGHYANNQIVLTLSYSLMNQVRQTARLEGVLPEDILIELIAEGVTRRAFEDAQRPAPSHLMTRTGYVAPDANGNVHQPQLSHHGMQQNNRGNHNGNNNRRFGHNNDRGNHFQGRNRQHNNHFKNKQRNGK